MNIERTSEHFKADPGAGGFQLAAERPNNDVSVNKHPRKEKREPPHEDRERRHKPREKPAPGDEEDEIRKAIELSKVTAVKEEEERFKENIVKGKPKVKSGRVGSIATKPDVDKDFDFGSGFEQFATYNN